MRALAPLILTALTACSPPDDPAPAVLADLGTHVIIPRYEAASLAMEAASRAAGAFCDAPDAAGLADARATLSTAHRAWKRSDVIAFGPARDAPWTVRARVDLWPVRPENVEALLASDTPMTPDGLAATINGSKGLPALAWLLWAEEDSVAAFTDVERGARRCEVLVGLSRDAAEQLAAMVSAWSPDGEDWLAELTEAPGPRAAFADPHEAVAELVNRLIFTVENVRLLKLGAPAGLDSAGQVQLDLLEARFGGGSLAAARENLLGMDDVFWGRFDDHDGLGVVDLLPEPRREELGEAFALAMAAGLDALDAIPEPLADSLLVDSQPVEAAVVVLRDLQVLLQADLAQALGVTVRFNDTDGD